jgi:hypothetical protein|nr:hypothetical protein KS05_00855 [Rhizobium brockwellii]
MMPEVSSGFLTGSLQWLPVTLALTRPPDPVEEKREPGRGTLQRAPSFEAPAGHLRMRLS